MEWWTHALYALAIVVVALIGWRAWRSKRAEVESIWNCYIQKTDKMNDVLERNRALRNDFHEVADSLDDERRTVAQMIGELYKAEDRAESAERSNRSYKGHNKRLRSENQVLKERVADLEGE